MRANIESVFINEFGLRSVNELLCRADRRHGKALCNTTNHSDFLEFYNLRGSRLGSSQQAAFHNRF